MDNLKNKGLPSRGEIVIYQAREGKISLKVTLSEETVWLTQKQMAGLFGKDVRTINEHLQNVFRDKELQQSSVIRNFRITATDGKLYQTRLYNLDAVISVGYRVNSKRATQFRIWATHILKEHILRGYTINEQRLLEQTDKLKELQKTIAFIEAKSHESLLENQVHELLHVISAYAKSFTIFEQYDRNGLTLQKTRQPKFRLTYKDSGRLIAALKSELTKKFEAGDLFGQEIGAKFESIIGALYQTFTGKELYRSIEEKSAHLLYFVIKDHPFVDGNKRIASMLFIHFLSRNNYLFKNNGELKINDNALVALALLIATSEPKEKEVMIKLITNLVKL